MTKVTLDLLRDIKLYGGACKPEFVLALVEHIEALNAAWHEDHLPRDAWSPLLTVDDILRKRTADQRTADDINAAIEIVPFAGKKSLAEAVQYWAGQLDKARDDWRQMKAERDAALALVKKGVAAVEAMIAERDAVTAKHLAEAKEGTAS